MMKYIFESSLSFLKMYGGIPIDDKEISYGYLQKLLWYGANEASQI